MLPVTQRREHQPWELKSAFLKMLTCTLGSHPWGPLGGGCPWMTKVGTASVLGHHLLIPSPANSALFTAPGTGTGRFCLTWPRAGPLRPRTRARGVHHSSDQELHSWLLCAPINSRDPAL